jgi:hypothetical protein
VRPHGAPPLRSTYLFLVALFSFALSGAATPAAAQVVKGRVLLAGGDRPVAGAAVTLHAADGRRVAGATTDSAGAFRLTAPRLGSFTLRAEQLGMATVETTPLALTLAQEVEVEIRMDRTVVPLQPLTVKARSSMDLGYLAGYFERVQRHELVGAGFVFTRDQIEERQAVDVADILRDLPSVSIIQSAGRLPAVLFRTGRGECSPKVYVNGVRQNRGGAAGTAAVVDELVRPVDLEGVEVYRGITEMPGEFYDEGHCGVILLWTRWDTDGGRPTTTRRLILAGVLVGLMTLLMLR